MELIWARATGLIRRGWRATIILALLAGLTAGVALTMIAAGRRTATVYDRFAAYSDVPELLVNLCPPGTDPAEEASLQACFTYNAIEEREVIAELPEVEAVSRGSFRGLTVAPVDDPEQSWMASSLALSDPGIASAAGRYQLVEGRAATRDDEVVANEVLLDRTGLEVGDRVVLTFWSDEELGLFGDDGMQLHGPQVDAEIVGAGRSLTDLTAAVEDFDQAEASGLHLSRALAERTDGAPGFGGLLVEAVDDDAAAATAAIEAAFLDRPMNVVPALGEDETNPIRDAIRYEGQAVIALGLVMALVVTVFIGQAVARQSRREWSDGPILRAIGITGREGSGAALLRGAAIGLPAAVVAVLIAVALSPFGPIGVGRDAEVDSGVEVDATVLVLGGLAVFAIVTVAAWIPLFRGRALVPPPTAALSTRARWTPALPPVVTAGVQLARRRTGSQVEVGTALASFGAAVVIAVAAVCLAASLTDLEETPDRFGAPWDLSVGDSGSDAPFTETLVGPDLRPKVSSAAAITGVDMEIAGDTAWVHAFVPIEDSEGATQVPVIEVPVSDGRAPTGPREIALGAITMRDANREIGDTVDVVSITTGETYEMEIVGTTIVNDTFEASPGLGAAVAPAFIEEAAPEASPDPIIVRAAPGVSTDDLAAVIAEVHQDSVLEPRPQGAVRNVSRIRNLPFVMTVFVVVLALASLVHALVLATNRNRRALGMLKGLGFLRREVAGTVICHATAYAVGALVLAVPLGIIAGRWGWRTVADQLGVPAVAVVPPLAVAGVAIAGLLLANVAAAYPAWRAARLPTAEALRAE